MILGKVKKKKKMGFQDSCLCSTLSNLFVFYLMVFGRVYAKYSLI